MLYLDESSESKSIQLVLNLHNLHDKIQIATREESEIAQIKKFPTLFINDEFVDNVDEIKSTLIKLSKPQQIETIIPRIPPPPPQQISNQTPQPKQNLMSQQNLNLLQEFQEDDEDDQFEMVEPKYILLTNDKENVKLIPRDGFVTAKKLSKFKKQNKHNREFIDDTLTKIKDDPILVTIGDKKPTILTGQYAKDWLSILSLLRGGSCSENIV